MGNHLQAQLEELQAARSRVFRELAALPDQALLETDQETKRSVRQLLSLYYSHERNHIVQIEKTRRAIDSYPSEVQMILAQAEQSRGDLLASLQGLSDADLQQKPTETTWSVEEILQHLMDVETRLLERILALAHKTAL